MHARQNVTWRMLTQRIDDDTHHHRKSMASQLENTIEQLLLAGKSRKAILDQLRQSENPQKLLFFLNNISHPARRKQYQVVNLVLVALLTFVTFKKLLATFAFGTFDLFLLVSLVVPTINLYLLREILRFRRIGYQFLFVLSLLSLLHPENHFLPEAVMQLTLSLLSGFLYLKIFPRQEQVVEIAG